MDQELLTTVSTDVGASNNTTVCIFPNSSELVKEGYWIKAYWFDVYFITTIPVIAVGLACNAFSVGIFASASKFRHTSTGQLLMALAVVDCLVLIGDGCRWASRRSSLNTYYTGLTFAHSSAVSCHLVNWLRYR